MVRINFDKFNQISSLDLSILKQYQQSALPSFGISQEIFKSALSSTQVGQEVFKSLPSFGISQEIFKFALSSTQVGQPIRDLMATSTHLSKMLQNSSFPLQSFSRLANYRSTFDSFVSSISDIQGQITPSFRHLKEVAKRRLLTAFKQAMLWPVPSMSEEFVYEIDWLLRQGKLQLPEQLVDLVQDYYAQENCKRLEKTISTWWDDLAYKIKSVQIEQAFGSHKLGWYFVSIKGLVDLVEGIAGDFVRRSNGELKTSDGKKQVTLGQSSQVVRRTLEVMGGLESPSIDKLSVVHCVMIEGAVYYVQDMYKSWDFDTQYNDLRSYPNISRHGINHGIQNEYASCINSLRCFLLLDALYGARKHYATKSGFGFF